VNNGTITREQIYGALFTLAQQATGIVNSSRKWKSFADVPPEQQPALFLVEQKERAMPESPGQPTKWGLAAEIVIYAWAAGDDIGTGEVLNPVLDKLQAALAPVRYGEKVTLGGLVQHVYIDGVIEKDGGVLGQQAMAVIPIAILTNS
jgi:hypothetical protein